MNRPSLALPYDSRPVGTEAGGEGVSLAQIGRTLKARWRSVAWPTLAAFLAALVFVQVVPPRYTGEAKILLETRDSFYTRPTQERPEQAPLIDEQAVASQVQVVMSRDLAREAIKRLGLVGNPEFDPLVDGLGPVRHVLVMLGLAKNPLDRAPEERVLETYFEHLLVYPVGKSRILTVEFRSKDPNLAARAANTIAELYLSFQETAKADTARSASAWLGQNVESLRARVAEAEAKVEDFRTRSGLYAGANNAPIGGQQLTELNTQLSQAKSAHADAQAKARLIKDMIKGGRAFEIPDVANNELIRRLIEQRINLRAQLALELRTLLPQHPRIKELNAQVNDLESQVRGAADRTVRTLENDAKIAGSRVESLQAALDTQKKVVAEANENEVQLRALEREARIQREQLESYLSRYREAAARDAGSAAPADARIVSRAIVPDTPSFPKKIPLVALATVATFVFAAGWIVAREMLSTPRPADAPAHGPRPAMGRREQDDADPVVEEPAARPEPASERAPEWPEPIRRNLPALIREPSRYDFEALISRLSRTAPEGRGRLICVAATAPGGVEDLARGFGHALAFRGERALLIEMEAQTPEERDPPGFSDLVAGEVSFLDVIEDEPGSRLHRIPPGGCEAELLTQEPEAVEIALVALGETYDWVICRVRDAAGPLLTLLAPKVDAVVIVSEEDPDHPGLVDLYDALRRAGAPDVVVARERAEVSATEAA